MKKFDANLDYAEMLKVYLSDFFAWLKTNPQPEYEGLTKEQQAAKAELVLKDLLQKKGLLPPTC